jgi:hypothetical protein
MPRLASIMQRVARLKFLELRVLTDSKPLRPLFFRTGVSRQFTSGRKTLVELPKSGNPAV